MKRYDFENNVGFIINRTAKSFVKAFDSELRAKVGVTVGQWKVMVMLVNQNGLTQKEIAERLRLESPTLIPILDKMEMDGLVVRKADPLDRRNNRIYRTEKADASWKKMMDCALRITQISTKDIPEQNIKTMKNVLEKMWQNLRFEFDVDCTISNGTVKSPLTGDNKTVITSQRQRLVQ
ncbi:MAG TPA: MarR family winged helix-turn-helix transcriptional regulator [Nitrososphaeraceae archaeon]|jgi:MarR family transcriptional regulator for hemolysin|nr:MarR family winged helix-turn-helix transcriptional regulator [Nitrososphaeraceae archaeon]